MKKLLLFVLMCCGAVALCAPEKNIVKPLVRKRNTGDIKQEIAREKKKLLTANTALIISSTEQIEVLIEKIEELVSGDDAFFSQQKARQLEVYKQQLVSARQERETMVLKVQQDTVELQKNFSVGGC